MSIESPRCKKTILFDHMDTGSEAYGAQTNRLGDIKINLRHHYDRVATSPTDVSKKETLPAGLLSDETMRSIGSKSAEVLISNEVLRHIHAMRPKIAKKVISIIPEAVSRPDAILKNLNASEGQESYLLAKRLGTNYIVVIQMINDGDRNEIVTSFTAPDRYFRKFPQLFGI